jgi:hypothetical protein
VAVSWYKMREEGNVVMSAKNAYIEILKSSLMFGEKGRRSGNALSYYILICHNLL